MRQKMRDARNAANLTADEAAKRIGVHMNALLRWERGDSEPMGAHLIALSRLYGVAADELLEECDGEVE